MMTGLDKYLRLFANLRRAPNSVFTEATRKRAPHKPILLLTLMDLVARGVITSTCRDFC
jgi:putative restriction endonuclease